jgi:hypothetical protein
MSSERIGPGDTVRHNPSGEEWAVAYADYERGDLSWCGWPEGVAKLSDCTLVQKATPEMRACVIGDWMRTPRGRDHRPGAIRRLYADEVVALDRARDASGDASEGRR